jgi:signal transduction histidine kinase
VDRGALEPSRHATCIDLDGQPDVIIVHDAVTLRDTSLVDAVAVATRLSGEHAALQRVVELQRTDLVESRQRLLGAADDERRALDDQLRGGAERHLMGVADLLREDLSVAQRCARWERMRQLLDGVIDDLGRLSAGLHPRIIERGVRDALTELAGGSPLPVRLKVHASVADDEHCTTIYYVCAEALSNAVKHASCRSVTIDLAASDDATTLRIADDGRGGIDPDIGSGLRGLIDRVESVGGRISFAGDAGGSTIAVMLPRHGSGSTVMVPAAGHDRDRPMWRTSHDVPIDDDPYVRTNSPEEVWT